MVHERKKFSCVMCETSFYENHKLENHVAIVHEKRVPYDCSMCDKEYIVKTELKRHIESQHMESNLKCNICLYQTSNKKLLKRHQLIHGPTKI